MKNASHLTPSQRANLGSYYTPPRLTRLLCETLAPHLPADFRGVALEPACGSGAFFAEKFPCENVRFIGADIDAEALALAERNFPAMPFFNASALSGISREMYGIGAGERVIVFGNPPYNDVTSLAKNNLKTATHAIDADIKSRDIGISFLLAIAKLAPDFIAFLHPLSYLVKESNFNRLRPLMRNYKLCDAVVFSSVEFSGTSKNCGFPIAAAVYSRAKSPAFTFHASGDDAQATTYADIRARKFRTLEGAIFSLMDFEYVSSRIKKYPSRSASPDGANTTANTTLRFFTMRDINALKRSRTFISEDSANAIKIEPAQLHYYCYIDAFKDIASKLPYYLGNFDVPINFAAFEPIKEDFLALSIAKHPDVFAAFAARYPAPSAENLAAARARVAAYFQRNNEFTNCARGSR